MDSWVPSEGSLSCQHVVELVTAYLEGALRAADRERVEEHLALCAPCDVYIEQIRQTITAAGRIDADELSDDTRAALLDAFRGWRAG